MKKKVLVYGTLAITMVTLSSVIMPITALATEIAPKQSSTISDSSQSDLQQQFGLSDNYLNSTNRNEPFIPTVEQQEKMDRLFNRHTRAFGMDDALILIGIIGAGYTAGHWAASEAHNRYGLSSGSYKANRWWWRGGIAAAAGIPAAVGFDDYFYGI